MGFQELRNFSHPEHSWAVDCYLQGTKPLLTHTHLDEALSGGLMPGLTILGGVASAGKSSLAVHVATNVAATRRRVAYFTLDDTWGNVTARSISCWSFATQGAKYQDIEIVPFRWSDVLNRTDEIPKLDLDPLKLSAYAFNMRKQNKVLGDAAVYEDVVAPYLAIIDSVATTTEIEQLLKTAAADGEAPELVVIDYVQQFQTGSSDVDNSDYARVSEVATRLQQIALSMNVPILVLSSLKKINAKEKDDPSLDWFRGSGVVGYASWAAVIITRGEKQGSGFQEIKLHTVKNKAGRTGQVTKCLLKGPYSYIGDFY